MTLVEQAIAYHERTKHQFERFAASLGYLDWANQPNPFRRFEGAPLISLRLESSADSGPSYDDLFREDRIEPVAVTFESVSLFLQYALALSAWKQFGDSKWALRINPSSGNLHPTEGYLVLGPIDRLNELPGVYHYAPKEHALERRTVFSMELWGQLTADFPAGAFLVGLSSIHWREAWKYGERAYRYCQHDAGHALAAISLSAATLGWRTHALTRLSDKDVASLLGLDRDADFTEAEREHPDCLLAILPNDSRTVPIDPATHPIPSSPGEFDSSRLATHAIAAIAQGPWSGQANRLSQEHTDWPVIDETTAACEKSQSPSLDEATPLSFPLTPLPSPLTKGGLRGVHPPIIPSRPSLPARQILFQRRSAVSMDGRTSITADAFYLMLDRTLPRFSVTPWHALGPPACVHLFLFVHRVEGLSSGLYAFLRTPSAIETLRAASDPTFAWEQPPGCPEGLPLFFLKRGDARRVAGQVSCGQEIAADGAFSLGMIAEFAPCLREFGPWFYRRLFWETGMIGQILYLEAEAAGIRTTGIGCFFDDPVHALLGLSTNDFQSLYHFTVGGATEDLRLMTWPAYERNSGEDGNS